ncbi:DUF4362 domain-containing protein [Bacillus sp. ISL-47]|uniref:DUF4362 domain-containing protein n=1 Tax=Bacillus sp. ISL-47 TaxID=2819130 RepID=UPI001BEB12D4|nr:DUF4362 domain-containing protein [Bacillus sp. ISL-47]MBT2688477.1 DUF4362 domain-containing protein [Bacillus sp. ISL-47]MBT2709060.1 DUF4362 domain-containing protein [Pseudomonas sp. ISL-84]
MKYIGVLLFSAILIAGCSKANSVDPPADKYDPKPKDVIHSHGSMEHLEELDRFIEQFNKQKRAKVRIVQYTIEGDPIMTDLDYDGEIIHYLHDTTRDQYGSGSLTEKNCENITKTETNTETYYNLSCSGTQEEIIYIEHDTSAQDRFEFHLKYGVGKRNEINTKDQQLIKDLQNGEMVTVSDFQFSEEELNRIYKAMILANYLHERNLSNACNQKPYESYELTVWINGGERHFEWTECDQSPDGQKVSAMKNQILEILKENELYKALPSSKGHNE